MWQLETAATKASSGSTLAGFDHGIGTADCDGEAGTVTPPSNDQVCSREYRPLRKSGPLRFQRMVALCSDIEEPIACCPIAHYGPRKSSVSEKSMVEPAARFKPFHPSVKLAKSFRPRRGSWYL